MAKKQTFSLAVTGSGRLMGMLFSELTRCFPKATVYDRSSATDKLRGVEVTLGKQGFLRPQDRAWAQRVARNLAAPPPTDITVDFASPLKGGPERVTVSNGRQSRQLILFVRNAKSIAELDANVRRIVIAIRSLL